MAAIFSNVLRCIASKNSIGFICRNELVLRRNLYGANFIGVDGYIQNCEKTKLQFRELKDKFMKRMQHILQADRKNMVFTEDLKNMIHLVEKPEEINDCVEMIKRYNQQNNEMRFGTFVFGPVVMRLFHHQNLPDLALETITDPALESFFNQFASFHIAMNLLYQNKRYNDVLNVYEILKSRKVLATRFPKDPVVLVLASCYKLNTAESLKIALQLFRDAKEAGAIILRKGVTFAVALALKQRQPNVALELLSLVNQPNYVTARNLKIMALAELERVDEALDILRNCVADVPENNQIPNSITQQAVDFVRTAIARSQNKEQENQLRAIEVGLKKSGLLTETDFDEILCSPILTKPIPRNRLQSTGFQNDNHFPKIPGGAQHRSMPYRKRQGLNDFDE